MRPTTLGLVGLCVVGALGLALQGCGMSQLERHTMAAGIIHGATGVSAHVIEHRAGIDAAAATTPAELDRAEQRWMRIAAAQGLVASAVDVYVAEVLAAAERSETGDADTTRAMRALVEAVRVYDALAAMLRAYGVDLPSVARVITIVGGTR